MLQRISIRNYAIISELDIIFSERLNAITGETGAGKSIIVGALGLILGERADTSALVNKEKKCVVEGFFNPSRDIIKDFLQRNELDIEEELVVRREIGINGKSRGFINDTPVNLVQLQELSSLLVDLHQQFDTLSLDETDFQRDVLDALAGQSQLVVDYHITYRQWQHLNGGWIALLERKRQFEKEADYNQFQFDELNAAAFRENELEETESELKMMNHSEEIRSALDKAAYAMHESETPIVQQLKSILNQLSSYVSYHPSLPALLERLRSSQVELQDIASEIERMSGQVNFDPNKAEQLNERLSLGYKLQKKHGVQSTAELLTIRDQLEEKLQAILDTDELIAQKEKETQSLLDEARTLAARISEGRRKQIKPFEDNVNKLLSQVGMPNARLKVELTEIELGTRGADAVEFLFDANVASKGQAQYQPVRKVASGGELNRLMLCIKSLVAHSMDLPTMIFDEIDSGISGEAAKQVGVIMKELAANRQVICITHQPQIAGKADTHFFVYKEIVKDKISTNIRQLTTDERITAIAKMLSGEKPTAAAMENAREMVMN